MTGPQYRLHVWTAYRPWWLLWLAWRWQEIVMEPPPDATFGVVQNMANELRAKGAGVRVENL